MASELSLVLASRDGYRHAAPFDDALAHARAVEAEQRTERVASRQASLPVECRHHQAEVELLRSRADGRTKPQVVADTFVDRVWALAQHVERSALPWPSNLWPSRGKW